MALGSKLKKILSERGITVKDFAAKIKIPPTTLYSFIKRDSTTGKLELIAKICRGLEIEISDFLRDESGVADYTSFSKEEAVSLVLADLLKKESVTFENAKTKERKTITLDDIVDTSDPYYILYQKAKNKEELSEYEKRQLYAYIKDALKSVSNSFKNFGEQLEKHYELLNENGQQKADEQLERTLEQIEMLTKIPEYRKDTE